MVTVHDPLLSITHPLTALSSPFLCHRHMDHPPLRCSLCLRQPLHQAKDGRDQGLNHLPHLNYLNYLTTLTRIPLLVSHGLDVVPNPSVSAAKVTTCYRGYVHNRLHYSLLSRFQSYPVNLTNIYIHHK
jgi:hypothetical protein